MTSKFKEITVRLHPADMCVATKSKYGWNLEMDKMAGKVFPIRENRNTKLNRFSIHGWSWCKEDVTIISNKPHLPSPKPQLFNPDFIDK